MKNIPLFFLVFAVLAAVVLIAYVAMGLAEQEEEPLQEKKECSGGETRNCMKGPCEGTQSCADGRWGTCIVERICEPGEAVPCAKNGCASAYKICNDCGTGYSECIGRNET